MGRVASTLQRFTSDEVKIANIHFYSEDLNTASYGADLEKIAKGNSILAKMNIIHQS